MYLDNSKKVLEIAKRVDTVVFGIPSDVEIEFPGAVVVKPEEGKNYISVEQVRKVIEMTRTKQTRDVFFVFREAEKLREEAENSMLKLLEEPKENYHFVLLTENSEALLPTILSRAEVYYLRKEGIVKEPPKADERTMEMAKRFLVAGGMRDYIELAEEIHKKKNEREWALGVLSITIELAYKSYLLTGKRQFLWRIQKFIEAHENIEKNGNVRLHLVADLC